MIASAQASKRPATELGALLRHWRDVRGKSQFDLSLDTGVSQRHISFVESGRSGLGRATLLEIAEALDVPLRDRNMLLLAAGYAPVYSEDAWNASDMQIVTKALQRMLRQHEPFPAIVMDRYWTVLLTNESAPRFFNRFIDMGAREAPRNMLHLLFDPHGLRPYILDWAEAAEALLARVRREAVGRIVDEKTGALLAALVAYPDVETIQAAPNKSDPLPIVPLRFVKNGEVLSYFSMITTVGTPQTAATQEMRVECLFPADEATEARHCDFMEEDR